MSLHGLHFGGPVVPVILQTEAAECGLVCLAMVAGAHGLRTDLASLRQRFSISLKGATLADLVRIADGMQLGARALRAEPDELGQIALPCILHWNLNHYVVLVALRGDEALIHDPAHGARRVKAAELSRSFSGVALELQPAPGFVPARQRRRVSLRQLLGPVSGLKRSLAQILALALALELFVLFSPFFMQWVVDGVLVSGDRDLLLTLGLGFTLLVGVQVLTAAARAWAVLVLSATLNQQWLLNVFAHLLRLPVEWFEKRQLGDVWSRFGALQQIQRALTTHFVEAVLDGALVLLTLVMMALYSPTLSAVALSAVAAYGLLRWAGYRPLREASEQALVFEARQGSHFLESVRGVLAIKLFNAQADRRSRFASLVVDTMNAQIAVRRVELWAAVAHRLLFGLERVAVVWIGAWLVLEGRLTVGMLFAFFAYKETFAARVSGLVDKAVELRMLGLQGERLADIVLTAPEPEAGSGQPEHAGIELRDVSFRYADGEPEVLLHLNLKIDAGESVAIVGASGGGKSTLLKLMLGIHEPNAGQVLAGGVPLARLGLARWREQVGVVMQDEPLFSGTVADNICFFSPEPDLAWLRECARVAAVHDEIEALPMGYDTLIGELGTVLSGGQKQRVLLARALYKRPSILLLDEATSALDVERERLVNQAVRKLALTRVIVAHRPETIASAGRVIVLQGGRIAQDLRSLSAAAPMP
ncbi:putative microcin-H47 secretion/processing ATP-binding protein MchF [Rubrivivax sp. A210]|uniref:peptidase domain-containing ABC transporter n=1 Tax=Rubrivivax sp. A210 TaxID=2772301 RepID=UPI00191B832B|nr:peptidase domain-containing ABC transporter [Rubrivivax sp. A210]CAD5373391.1 putative microcin-H47 secretion/processing ATP-binding protein MchF [Rubrivivax sp. A210]